MVRQLLTVTELTDSVMSQMETSGFMESTRGTYRVLFNKLCHMADERGDLYYTTELGQAFIQDDSHIVPENTERYHHERTCSYARCVKFIESFLRDGEVDWTPTLRSASFPITGRELQESFSEYMKELVHRKLKPNTIDGYRRFTYYFIEYLESKGYQTVREIKHGDIVSFITVICSERYQATSLGAHLPGLKIFLGMDEYTKGFLYEVPEHLPKKRDILNVYSDEEYEKIMAHLDEAEDISFRNKAITILAFNTGLRAVDICGLKLSDIDWEHNCIHLVQQKTMRSHDIPLTEMIGNALIDYLLNERPVCDSEYVFLRSAAPYQPLMGHSGIRRILFNVVNDSDIKGNGRIYGTRITRHSAASRMLRKGIPLSVISEMLGHSNKNSVMVYITTDDAKLAECTLPLPKGGQSHE